MPKLAELLKDADFKAEFDDAIKAAVTPAIEEATTGLKAKNAELLDEKKKEKQKADDLAKKLEAFGDLDAGKVAELIKKLGDDEEAKLLKDGKLDEVIAKRTERIIGKFDKAAKDAEDKAKASDEKATKYESAWKSERLDNQIARKVSGLADGALPKVQRDAREFFDVNEEGEVVTKEGAPLGPGGKPLTLDNYGDYLLDTSPFYFPPSGGAGGQGGQGRKGKTQVIDANDKEAFANNLEKIASGEVTAKM